ncbi:hypothetical protein FA13DRAFT_1742819 [Coprinellus micaceus]|uniref:Uncharacterized protein n=1 Tax=Coprinellus micaceus TaxID=71717 RepID=A0A4Y7SFF5_COPMI|nr:hypothetical protein FA13DRAFT_1742819 [Coprinellus micaceus]
MQGYTSSPAHRSNQSLSLAAPGGQPQGQNAKQQRRMTVSSQTSLSLVTVPRPPSPLRNSFTMDSSTGIDPDGVTRGRQFASSGGWKRSESPASSGSGIAAGFVQRVNNLVSSVAPRSPGNLPSDAELEAEAERERERSRREAEAILMREAQQRKGVEERMAAMMGSPNRLPPPPSSQPPPKTPSPASSHKESGGWWQAAKNKLTPTKDSSPITPAQQIILDAKAKEREHDPNPTPSANLNIPMPPPTRKPLESGANSPSREGPPAYVQFTNQGTVDVAGTLLAIAKRFEKLEKWTIGHVRALEDRMNDVERWLVDKENTKQDQKTSETNGVGLPNAVVQQELGEIRDEVSELQGRVGELGREMAKMATSPGNLSSGPKAQTASVSIAPRQSSSAAIHESPVIPAASLEGSVAELFSTPRHNRLTSASARESTSPPLASNARTGSGTRLPYPTGDYNSPPETFSPTHSPPASLNSAKRKSMSISSGISGLPSTSYSSLESPLTSCFVGAKDSSVWVGFGWRDGEQCPGLEPSANVSAEHTKDSLPPPKSSGKRPGSVSPTPRKRYTVALGGPIVAPPELDSPPPPEPKTKRPLPSAPASAPGDASTSVFGRRVAGTPRSLTREPWARWAAQQQTRNLTVQKKRSTGSMSSVASVSSVDKEVFSGRRAPLTTGVLASPAPITGASAAAPSIGGIRHVRAQSPARRNITSTPTPAGTYAPAGTTAPLRVRSKSSDRLNSDYGGSSGSNSPLSGLLPSTANNSSNSASYFPPATPNSTKFVDPLLLRRKQEPPSGGKLAVGQLVAFFDKDKEKRKGRR